MPAEPQPITWMSPPPWNEPSNFHNVAIITVPWENLNEEDVKRRDEFLQDLVSRGAQLFHSADDLIYNSVLTHVGIVRGADSLIPFILGRCAENEFPSIIRTIRLRRLFAAQQGYPGEPPAGFSTEPEIWATWVAKSEREKQERRRVAALQQGRIDDTTNPSQGKEPGVQAAGVQSQNHAGPSSERSAQGTEMVRFSENQGVE